MKRLLIIILFLSVFIQNGFSCSMFKLTMYGKTMVGNNEDFWNPNTRIWFEKGKDKEYGAAFVGYDNFHPQGGINQAGLVFDGFTLNYKEVTDTLDKVYPAKSLLSDLMKNCETVEDVRNYLLPINLSFLRSGMLLFVDKSGNYLVAEGDSLMIGNNPNYVLSNFRPSCIKNDSEIKIPFYHKGKRTLESYRDTSINYCASVLDSLHQESQWGFGTIYSTLYDLDKGNIHLYYYHDYRHAVKFNLTNELEKGDHSFVISELFPDNQKGLQYLNSYNETSCEINNLDNAEILNDSIRMKYIARTLFRKDKRLVSTFVNRINEIGISWMQKEKYEEAIAVLKVSVKAVPNSWIGYELLADAYMRNNQTKLALENYEISVKLNPDNLMGKQQIERIKADNR